MKRPFVFRVFFLTLFFNWGFLCGEPVGIFAHGFWDFAEQAGIYKDIFSVPLRTFSFPDSEGKKINIFKVNMAQRGDMDALLNAYKKAIGENDAIFLVGLSRGASTIITLMGTEKLDHVKAVVLESPFDCLECLVETLICKRLHLGWVPWLSLMMNYLVPYVFRQYKKDGIKPMGVVQNLPKNLPILIVCSKEDTLVPASSSIGLYNCLRETGHDHAYLLVLDHGEHSKLVFGSDAQRYKNVLNAFCKKYGLPYDKESAQQGMNEFLTQCPPDFSE